jgi:CBS domain-containing protein
LKGEQVNIDIESNRKPDIKATQMDLTGISTARQQDLWVKDVMNPHVITITSTESIKTGVRLMSENHISCLPVVDNDVFKGLITQKTIIMDMVRENVISDTSRVHDQMLSTVPTVSPETSVLDACEIAHHKNVKWLPVLVGQTLVGIITQTDLTRALMCFDKLPDVVSTMSSDTVTVHAGSSVADAANIMVEHSVSCVVAIQNERVLGILTEKDLLKTATESGKTLSDICVVDTMSFPVIAANPSDSLISANRLMDRMHIHHLVVMEDEQPCGIITRTDVLKAFQQAISGYK